MEYIGIQTQKSRNDFRSMLLLFMFPCLVIGLVYLFCVVMVKLGVAGNMETEGNLWSISGSVFLEAAPYAIGGIALWFVIAYFLNTLIIKASTGAKTLERKQNKRVYNLVENLCMSQGMKMPKINILYDNSLNAFASGINGRTYTVTLSQGIIEKLDDEELEAVIAHELTHIRNHDVRLLIVSIVFVGVFSMIAQIAFRSALNTSCRSSGKDDNKSGTIIILLLAAVFAAVGYLLATLMRFAISRKREYLADAGSAEMTKNPQALASALRKISEDPNIEAVTREDVAQLFIQHPGKQAAGFIGRLGGLFATHPPIEERIRILEQF